LRGGPAESTITMMRTEEPIVAAVLALFLAGCAGGAAPAGPAPGIVGPEWVATDIAGGGVGDAQITLTLEAAGRAGGRGGCNSYGGSYTLSGTALHFGPMAATKMACAPALMDREQRYFNALMGVVRYALADDGALMLTTADGKTLLFRRASP